MNGVSLLLPAVHAFFASMSPEIRQNTPVICSGNGQGIKPWHNARIAAKSSVFCAFGRPACIAFVPQAVKCPSCGSRRLRSVSGKAGTNTSCVRGSEVANPRLSGTGMPPELSPWTALSLTTPAYPVDKVCLKSGKVVLLFFESLLSTGLSTPIPFLFPLKRTPF